MNQRQMSCSIAVEGAVRGCPARLAVWYDKSELSFAENFRWTRGGLRDYWRLWMVKWLPNSEDTPPVWSMLPISVPLFPAFMESQPWVMENRGCILKQQQAGEAQPFFFIFSR